MSRREPAPTGRPRATTRRAFLAQIVAVAPAAAVGCARPTPDAPEVAAGTGPDTDVGGDACAVTPENILGPYFREGAPLRTDLNPTGETGTPLRVTGRVLGGADCATPLADVEIDLWHAGPDGQYDNDSPDYRFRGRVRSGADGAYAFTTLLPGHYLNGPTYRPRHVHYKVVAAGHAELVTQLYFEGDPYLETDPYDLPELIVALADDGAGGLAGVFDVTLRPA